MRPIVFIGKQEAKLSADNFLIGQINFKDLFKAAHCFLQGLLYF